MRLPKLLRLLAAAAMVLWPALAWSADYVELPGGTFPSVLGNDASGGQARVGAFRMRVTPVTRGEFASFLASHPQWERQNAPRAFVDADYLADGLRAGAIDAAHTRQPVTRVSWFAAQAFCEAEDARLPTWLEWEYAAAADATRPDARADGRWLAQILGWYARPATQELPAVGGAPNFHGVSDLHGVVWEWVDDFNSLLVNGDSRSANDPDKLRFCGAGAIDLQQRDNYAVLMRVALLSSLKSTDSTSSLGFRCVKPPTGVQP